MINFLPKLIDMLLFSMENAIIFYGKKLSFQFLNSSIFGCCLGTQGKVPVRNPNNHGISKKKNVKANSPILLVAAVEAFCSFCSFLGRARL